MTLFDLSKTGHTYWRFSQSEEGKVSVNDKHFAEYIPGKITYAEDYPLSFTRQEYICTYFYYGDLLTKLCFDPKNELFQEISDTPVNEVRFDIYISNKLLTETNYNLSDLDTILLMFNICNKDQLFGFFSDSELIPSLEHHLRNIGCTRSADVVKTSEEYFFKKYKYQSELELKENLINVMKKSL